MSTARTCDLCGLEVTDDRFSLRHGDKSLSFCCSGCEGVYRMLNGLEAEDQNGKEARKGKGRG